MKQHVILEHLCIYAVVWFLKTSKNQNIVLLQKSPSACLTVLSLITRETVNLLDRLNCITVLSLITREAVNLFDRLNFIVFNPVPYQLDFSVIFRCNYESVAGFL